MDINENDVPEMFFVSSVSENSCPSCIGIDPSCIVTKALVLRVL